MVSQSVIISMIFAICLSALAVIVPFVVIFLIAKKRETGMFASGGLGILAYFWSQYLLPIPLLFVLTNFSWYMTIYNEESILYILITAVMLSILAGLGRLWAVWLMNKRTPSLYRAIESGIGFAAFRAMSVIASYLTYVKYANAVNTGGREGLKSILSGDTSNISDADLDKMIKPLTEAKIFDICMEGVNVIWYVFIEIALIVIIYKGLIKKKTWIATLISTGVGFAFSFVTMVLGKYIETGANQFLNNGIMFACGVVSLWFILKEIRYYRRINSYGGIPNEVI